MSDYIDETPLTDEEIAAAIAAAKKAKAEKAKAQNQNKSQKPKNKKSKAKAQDEESSENLFEEIDSAAESEEEEENLSPKMKSAKSFSNAFAAAKSRREKDLQKKKAAKEAFEEEEEEEIADRSDEDEEEAIFETDEADNEEYYEEEESDEPEDDGEYEEYEEYDENDENDENDEDDDGIFEADTDDGEYVDEIDIDDEDDIDTGYEYEDEEDEYDEEYDEDDEDEDDEYDEDDDDESAFSTKTKVIIGIIIAVLVLAIIGAGIFFLSKGGSEKPDTDTAAVQNENGVTSLSFADSSLSLRVGETVPLQIIVEPETAEDKVLKLKSNDPSIAKVDEQGKITGVSSGTTTVTATLKSNEAITASLIVNVIDEDQNAINIYNKFVNAIVEETTDIDPASDSDVSEEESEDSDSDSDSETPAPAASKSELTGNIIKDLDSDGSPELALYFTADNDESKVRIFHLINEGEEDIQNEETQYDELGNPIEEESKAESEAGNSLAPAEKVLSEIDEDTDLYRTCFNTLESDVPNWNTSYIEVKEEESAAARVTILSSGYGSPVYAYECDDTTIASVDDQGNIKGLKPGTTFVTVTSPLNSDAMAKIKVRVKDDTDLLDDYLANVPVVNSTNDPVFPTETLTGKAIVDIDNDGISELLLRFSLGNNVEIIHMVKVENEQCIVYKTYNNLSDLYEYSEGSGYYSNTILVHYTSGKVCMEYRAVVAKDDSNTRTSEQKILSLESGGKLSELVNFKTTTDVTTKTVTSEVVIEDDEPSTVSEDEDDEESEAEWYDDDQTYDDEDNEDDEPIYYEDEDDYNASYARFTFDDIAEAAESGTVSLDPSVSEKKLPVPAGAPGDEDDNEPVSRLTSTVTSEVTEETTKYFVNGTPVEQSVYEETLSTYSARYSVWSAWEGV